MLRNADSLIGFTVVATDGEIGEVDDLLFDDEKWNIRYAVVNIGSWLSGRKVLIAPVSFGALDWDKEELQINLTKDQVEHSPDIDVDQPVSRQHLLELHRYYEWPPYWPGSGAAMIPPVPASPDTEVIAGTSREEELRKEVIEEQGDPHLRSMAEVKGYHIQAVDGEIGHVDTFVLDDGDWTVRCLVVDTRNWWPGKHSVISVKMIDAISWGEQLVYTPLGREEVKSGPKYDPAHIKCPE